MALLVVYQEGQALPDAKAQQGAHRRADAVAIKIQRIGFAEQIA